MVDRAYFNRPYSFIKILEKSASDFMREDNYEGASIYWFDYDGPIMPSVVDDIATLGTKARRGDFLFVTVCGEPPGSLEKDSVRDRLTGLREVYSDLCNALSEADAENHGFPLAVTKIVGAAFRNAFAMRRDGECRVFFNVQYADGVRMVTIGGMYDGRQECDSFQKRLNAKMPFLACQNAQVYRIRKFDLTEKERVLFDLAVTSDRSNAKDIGTLKRLGFRDVELRSYGELLRYHPRYVETLI